MIASVHPNPPLKTMIGSKTLNIKIFLHGARETNQWLRALNALAKNWDLVLHTCTEGLINAYGYSSRRFKTFLRPQHAHVLVCAHTHIHRHTHAQIK